MRRVLTRIPTMAVLAIACAAFATSESAESRQPPPVVVPSERYTLVYDRVERRRVPPRFHRRVVSLGERVAKLATRYVGVGYSYGGASPSQGFDCSGFVMYVYGKFGVDLPHHAASQYGYGRSVPYSRLRPGDLVFFSGLGHVGLYVGKGRFIDAPQSGDEVRTRPLAQRLDSYVGARRIVAA